MEAEEVEALLPVAQAGDPGLVRVQMQPERLQGLRGQDPRMLRAFSGGTQDDEVVALCRPPDYADLGRVGAGQQGRVGQSGRHNPGTRRLFLPGAGGAWIPDRVPRGARDCSTVDSAYPDLPAPLRRPSRKSTEADFRKPPAPRPPLVIGPAPAFLEHRDYADMSRPRSTLTSTDGLHIGIIRRSA